MIKKKILIVDDEEDTLLVLEKQLTIAGYSVITANNGELALLLSKSQRPDLIVLDVQMPGMDGGEVDYRLKEDAITKDIPVVFSTCLLSSNEASRETHKRGGNIMLAKANDTKELITVINEILSDED